MSKEIIKLTEKEIESLKEVQTPLHFQNDFDLIYESQIPNIGIIFLEGEIKLLKKKKVLDSLPIGSMVGLYHLINNTPLPMGVKIYKNSSILMLEKSTVLEALAVKSGPLYQIISGL